MRTLRGLIVCGLLGLGLLVATQPASADPWFPPSSGGGESGGGFNAWAYWASVTGGSATSTPEPCVLEVAGQPPLSDAHIEYVAYELPPGSGHFSVWKDCVRNGYTVNPDLPADGRTWDPIDNWQVTAGDPQQLINEALTHINPNPPAIGTSPGGANSSLVGISTWLWLEGGVAPTSATMTDGPLSVTVTATPISVSWDTGDGSSATCRDAANVGTPDTETCSHVYERSSAGQTARDSQGRPAYTVSANIEYVGGYEVFLNNVDVGGRQNIGGVARVSEVPLAVAEAQATNTGVHR